MIRKFLIIGAAATAAACASHAADDKTAMARAEAPMASGDAMMKKHHAPHVIETPSTQDFTATLAAAQAAIDKRGFKTFAVIDHAKGAASIDADLRPTTLIIFGNPKGGTPLMQANQLLGIELPLKILIAEQADGTVHIVTPDIEHLFHEYGIAELEGPKTKISGALAAMAAEAAAAP